MHPGARQLDLGDTGLGSRLFATRMPMMNIYTLVNPCVVDMVVDAGHTGELERIMERIHERIASEYG